jgi:hypothetical protein
MIINPTSRCRLARLVLGSMVFIFSLALVRPAQALGEVNLHVSAGISGNALLYKFALEKGF